MTSRIGYKAICFIDMPFGRKYDPVSGTEIDFDQIYKLAIRPAVLEVGLTPLRGDEEKKGGNILTDVYARLLLAEFVVADLTLSNPNVFYELGIRHAVRGFTTVPIAANLNPLPFDVNIIRTVMYQLEKGQLTKEAATTLKLALKSRLEASIRDHVVMDSPLFQFIEGYPKIELPESFIKSFEEQVKQEQDFHDSLDKANAETSNEARRIELLKLEKKIGNVKTASSNILLSLLLSFRDIEAWQEMISLYETFPEHIKEANMVRQQLAIAYNRRNGQGDREKALDYLRQIVKDHGEDAKTLGIMGRVYRDKYLELKRDGNLMASAVLNQSLEAYRKGFSLDPRDYYPGIYAIILLTEKGDEKSLQESKELIPLVKFAIDRRGGIESNNYWDIASLLTLACINGDLNQATDEILPKVLTLATGSMLANDLVEGLSMIRNYVLLQGKDIAKMDNILRLITERAKDLEGSNNDT